MKKKGAVPLLLLAGLLAGLALAWRLNRIAFTEVIDGCFDAGGAYCVLAERGGETGLYRFSPGGVLLGETPLDSAGGGARTVYRALEADGLGSLYVLAGTVKDLAGTAGDVLVLSETVRMYDAALVRQRDALTLDHPGGAERAAIRKIEALGGTVFAVCEQNGRVEVLAADAVQGGAPYSLAAFTLPAGAGLYDLAADGGGSVLYTTEAGGLWRVEDGDIRDVSAALGRAAVPADFFLSASGQICFQERLSGLFYQFDGDAPEEVRPPEQHAPERLRGAFFPGFALYAGLCTLASWLLLWGLWALVRLLRREAGLLKRLLLRLLALCALGALALALTLTALELGPARKALGETLLSAAGSAASALDGQGLDHMDLLAVRGTETASGLARALDQTAETLLKDEGLGCTFTLYDSRRQRWFAALDENGGGEFAPVTDMRLESAIGAAMGGAPILVEDRAGGGFSALLAVPTGGNTAVLEVRAVWADTLGAALRSGLARNGLCALAFAAALWLGGAYILRRGLRPLVPLRRGLLALAGGRWEGPVPADHGDELGVLAQAVNQAAQRHADALSALSARETAGLCAVQRDLLALSGGGVHTGHMCTLYAAFDDPESFERLRARLDRLGAVVRMNHGCVAACGGGSLLALFSTAWDAARSAAEFRESFRAEGAAEPRMVVDAGRVTVGPAGGTVLAASECVARGVRLAGGMAERGAGCLMTQPALDAMGAGRTLSSRFVGCGAGGIRFHELLDGLPYHQRELTLSTREQFESGAAAFEQGDLERARACFAAVAGVDRGDAMALYYLARCREECGGGCSTIF